MSQPDSLRRAIATQVPLVIDHEEPQGLQTYPAGELWTGTLHDRPAIAWLVPGWPFEPGSKAHVLYADLSQSGDMCWSDERAGVTVRKALAQLGEDQVLADWHRVRKTLEGTRDSALAALMSMLNMSFQPDP